MVTDREKASLRGLVERSEVSAKSEIHWQSDPFRHNQWLDEIAVYDLHGRLLEWYSPENQLMEQEAIRHRYVYDAGGKLVEKRGFSEDDSPEDITLFIYDQERLAETTSTSFISHSGHHIYYDERENVRLIETYDSSGSLAFVQRWNQRYSEDGNLLKVWVYKEEGPPGNLSRSSPEHHYVTTFNDSGTKIKYERYSSDWLEEVKSYNSSGQKIESTLFSFGNQIAWRYRYTYDEKDRLITTAFEHGSNIRRYVCEYDEFDNMISLLDHENAVLINEERHTYEYDFANNWTKKIENRDNVERRSSTTEFERKITYF